MQFNIDFKMSLMAAVRIYRSLTTGDPKIRTTFALLPIDVKLAIMRDCRIIQSLAEFQKYYANI